jgi:hypothetical protein
VKVAFELFKPFSGHDSSHLCGHIPSAAGCAPERFVVTFGSEGHSHTNTQKAVAL